MKISVIIPVYQGEKTIARLVDGVCMELSSYELEVILVNDGSTDNSNELCRGVFKKYQGTVKYINLSKNFGEHNAVMAGLNYAKGDYAVIMDDDFQNSPNETHKLIDKIISGKYDVVYGYYGKKYHSWLRNSGSSFNNIISTWLLGKPRDLYLSSFKCMNSFMVKELIKYKGPFPYVDGLVLRITRNIGRVKVLHEKAGDKRSRYNFNRLVGLWLNMFVNFSIYPLRIATLLGFLFSIIGGIAAIYLVVDKFMHPAVPQGITSIMVSILLFSGIQLVMLGLIGEYIGKEYLTANQTPQYVIRDILAVNTSKEENG